MLAQRIYEADDAVETVFVASNQVVASGGGEWTEDRLDGLGAIISDFFLFYPDA